MKIAISSFVLATLILHSTFAESSSLYSGWVTSTSQQACDSSVGYSVTFSTQKYIPKTSVMGLILPNQLIQASTLSSVQCSSFVSYTFQNTTETQNIQTLSMSSNQIGTGMIIPLNYSTNSYPFQTNISVTCQGFINPKTITQLDPFIVSILDAAINNYIHYNIQLSTPSISFYPTNQVALTLTNPTSWQNSDLEFFISTICPLPQTTTFLITLPNEISFVNQSSNVTCLAGPNVKSVACFKTQSNLVNITVTLKSAASTLNNPWFTFILENVVAPLATEKPTSPFSLVAINTSSSYIIQSFNPCKSCLTTMSTNIYQNYANVNVYQATNSLIGYGNEYNIQLLNNNPIPPNAGINISYSGIKFSNPLSVCFMTINNSNPILTKCLVNKYAEQIWIYDFNNQTIPSNSNISIQIGVGYAGYQQWYPNSLTTYSDSSFQYPIEQFYLYSGTFCSYNFTIQSNGTTCACQNYQYVYYYPNATNTSGNSSNSSNSSVSSSLSVYYIYQLVNNKCNLYCKAGQYLDQISGNCLNCTSNCGYCTSATNCLACGGYAGATFSTTGQGVSCVSCAYNQIWNQNSSSCVNSCFGASFFNNSTKTCQNCPSGCNSCTNSTFCTSCSSAYNFTNATGNCSLKCPDATKYWNSTSNTCQVCPTGTSINKTSNQCFSCPSNCATCNSTACLSCSNTFQFTLKNGSCMDACYLNGTNFSTTLNKCVKCSSNQFFDPSSASQCTNCLSPCQTCFGNYYGSCSSCISKQYVLNDFSACQDVCSVNSTIYNSQQGKCQNTNSSLNVTLSVPSWIYLNRCANTTINATNFTGFANNKTSQVTWTATLLNYQYLSNLDQYNLQVTLNNIANQTANKTMFVLNSSITELIQTYYQVYIEVNGTFYNSLGQAARTTTYIGVNGYGTIVNLANITQSYTIEAMKGLQLYPTYNYPQCPSTQSTIYPVNMTQLYCFLKDQYGNMKNLTNCAIPANATLTNSSYQIYLSYYDRNTSVYAQSVVSIQTQLGKALNLTFKDSANQTTNYLDPTKNQTITLILNSSIPSTEYLTYTWSITGIKATPNNSINTWGSQGFYAANQTLNITANKMNVSETYLVICQVKGYAYSGLIQKKYTTDKTSTVQFIEFGNPYESSVESSSLFENSGNETSYSHIMNIILWLSGSLNAIALIILAIYLIRRQLRKQQQQENGEMKLNNSSVLHLPSASMSKEIQICEDNLREFTNMTSIQIQETSN